MVKNFLSVAKMESLVHERKNCTTATNRRHFEIDTLKLTL